MIYFGAQIAPDLASGSSCKMTLVFFWRVPSFFKHKIFQAHLLSLPWINHFLQGTVVAFNGGLDVCMLSRVWLFETPWTVAHQAPLSMGLFLQEY